MFFSWSNTKQSKLISRLSATYTFSYSMASEYQNSPINPSQEGKNANLF